MPQDGPGEAPWSSQRIERYGQTAEESPASWLEDFRLTDGDEGMGFLGRRTTWTKAQRIGVHLLESSPTKIERKLELTL